MAEHLSVQVNKSQKLSGACAAAGLLLTACQGGVSPASRATPPDPTGVVRGSLSAVPASGKLTLPEGVALVLTDLTVRSARDEAPVAGDGSFDADVPSHGGTLVALDAAGQPVLLGWGKPDGTASLDVSTTAAWLLQPFYRPALALQDDRTAVLAALAAEPATAALAGDLALAIADDPLLLAAHPAEVLDLARSAAELLSAEEAPGGVWVEQAEPFAVTVRHAGARQLEAWPEQVGALYGAEDGWSEIPGFPLEPAFWAVRPAGAETWESAPLLLPPDPSVVAAQYRVVVLGAGVSEPPEPVPGAELSAAQFEALEARQVTELLRRLAFVVATVDGDAAPWGALEALEPAALHGLAAALLASGDVWVGVAQASAMDGEWTAALAEASWALANDPAFRATLVGLALGVPPPPDPSPAATFQAALDATGGFLAETGLLALVDHQAWVADVLASPRAVAFQVDQPSQPLTVSPSSLAQPVYASGPVTLAPTWDGAPDPGAQGWERVHRWSCSCQFGTLGGEYGEWTQALEPMTWTPSEEIASGTDVVRVQGAFHAVGQPYEAPHLIPLGEAVSLLALEQSTELRLEAAATAIVAGKPLALTLRALALGADGQPLVPETEDAALYAKAPTIALAADGGSLGLDAAGAEAGGSELEVTLSGPVTVWVFVPESSNASEVAISASGAELEPGALALPIACTSYAGYLGNTPEVSWDHGCVLELTLKEITVAPGGQLTVDLQVTKNAATCGTTQVWAWPVAQAVRRPYGATPDTPGDVFTDPYDDLQADFTAAPMMSYCGNGTTPEPVLPATLALAVGCGLPPTSTGVAAYTLSFDLAPDTGAMCVEHLAEAPEGQLWTSGCAAGWAAGPMVVVSGAKKIGETWAPWSEVRFFEIGGEAP